MDEETLHGVLYGERAGGYMPCIRASVNDFPSEGKSGVIYIAKTEREIFIWDNGNYVSVAEHYDFDGLRVVYAAIDHNHNFSYAPLSHNHDTLYAVLSHNHDTQYAATNHLHDDRYSRLGHNHDGSYASLTHNHDDLYSAITHNHDEDYAAIIHNHDESYAALDHSHAQYLTEHQDISGKVNYTDIVNALNSTATGVPLSAYQGKVLKDSIDAISTLLTSDNANLDSLQEVVDYIENNKTLIDGITTSKVSVSDIIDNLTSDISNKPLSAAQGVVLKGILDNKANVNTVNNFSERQVITSQVYNEPILKLVSAAQNTNFILERTGGSQCVLESGAAVGLFGTKTNHPLQVRTNFVNRMTFDTAGGVTLASTVPASSNSNQLATTKWVNDKIGDLSQFYWYNSGDTVVGDLNEIISWVIANKKTSVVQNATSDTFYPTCKAVYSEFQRKGVVLYRANSPDAALNWGFTSGISGDGKEENEYSADTDYKVQGKDFSQFKFLKCYFNAASDGSNRTRMFPELMVEIALLDEFKTAFSSPHFVASNAGSLPNDKNVTGMATVIINEAKTCFSVINISTIYGTLGVGRNNGQQACVLIVGYND